jgi:hypothetical protein
MVLGAIVRVLGLFDARGAVLILCDHLPSTQRLWVVGVSVQRLCECASTCLFCVVFALAGELEHARCNLLLVVVAKCGGCLWVILWICLGSLRMGWAAGSSALMASSR